MELKRQQSIQCIVLERVTTPVSGDTLKNKF